MSRTIVSLFALLALTLGILNSSRWNEKSAFLIPKLSLSVSSEKPFYKKEIINAKQNLPFAHVSSMIELPDGTLGALWYGGSYEYCYDNKIYFSKKENGSWTLPIVIMTAEHAEHDLGKAIKCLGNPLICSNSDGSMRLIFVTIALGKWSGSQLNTSLSKDGGYTWSKVDRMTLSPLYNFSELVRNRPIPITGGGFCIPIYQELVGKFPELLWLKNRGHQFSICKTRIAGGCSTLQPSMIALDQRKAIVLLRDWTQEKRIFISRTMDAGRTWSKPMPTHLQNPDSGISGILLPNRDLLVAYNDSTNTRSNLSLAVSSDEGCSWKKIVTIEKNSKECFCYPYLMQSSNGIIYVSYTWSPQSIKIVSFNYAWLIEQEAKYKCKM